MLRLFKNLEQIAEDRVESQNQLIGDLSVKFWHFMKKIMLKS
jgi:hypothetical protein